MHIRLVFSAALAALAAAAPATTNIQDTITAPSAGCGKMHLWRGISHPHLLLSSGKSRVYEVNLPLNYDNDKAYPVVMGFHGSPGIGAFFELDTRMSERRNSGQRIMVYPYGEKFAWAGANYSATPVSEDLQFVADILAELRSEYCIDDTRIYATGFSNGAGFVNILACDPKLSAEFAAFAPHSGAYYTPFPASSEDCKPARTPIPIISIHGGSDGTVPYRGGVGEGGQLPSIDDWLAAWAHRNGCEGKEEPVQHTDEGNVHIRQWKGCGNRTDVVMEHWKEDTMGHCWAAPVINFSQVAALQGPTTLDADTLIMNFFSRFQKP